MPKINRMMKELEKYEKTIDINSNTVKNKKEEDMLLKHIKERLSKGEYEFAIDRLHTLLKYKFEAIFKESTTFSILTATKK